MTQNQNSKKKNSLTFGFLRQVKEIVVTALLVWIVTAAIVEGSRVPTGSMENSIMTGDFLLINKFIYGSSTPRYIPLTDISIPYFQLPSIMEPEREDIVVFEYPGDRDELQPGEITFYVKRCIGLPGDMIEISNKVISVNGAEFPIPADVQYLTHNVVPKGYTDPMIFPKGAKWNADNFGPFKIPAEGDIIKLTADNVEKWRTIIDREHGTRVVDVNGNEITINGRIVTEYKFQKDYYFMMGDNRDNSADSRYWGLVPRDKIVGQPIIVLWSWDSDIPFEEPLKLLGSIRWERIAKLVK